MMISTSDISQLGVQELVKVISGLLSRDKGDTKSHHPFEAGSPGKLEVDKVGQLRQCQHVCEDLRLVLLVVRDVLGLMLLHNWM